MIQWMMAIWSLVPLPFLNPAWTSGNDQFVYCWSLAWRILNITLPRTCPHTNQHTDSKASNLVLGKEALTSLNVTASLNLLSHQSALFTLAETRLPNLTANSWRGQDGKKTNNKPKEKYQKSNRLKQGIVGLLCWIWWTCPPLSNSPLQGQKNIRMRINIFHETSQRRKNNWGKTAKIAIVWLKWWRN